MPWRSAVALEASKMARFAALTASTSASGVSMAGEPVRYWRNVSTAMALATSPAWWPPMPSATA
ncbi:MAG: hypothetical protein R2715_22465 [Ilumatobacteraceae bacterium]